MRITTVKSLLASDLAPEKMELELVASMLEGLTRALR